MARKRDRDKQNEYNRRWREKNPDYMRDYMRKYRQSREGKAVLGSSHAAGVRANRLRFEELKATLSCLECGETHPACLEFHHRDPTTKTKKVSLMVNQRASWKAIEAEIAKCDVLCANCHRKRHHP